MQCSAKLPSSNDGGKLAQLRSAINPSVHWHMLSLSALTKYRLRSTSIQIAVETRFALPIVRVDCIDGELDLQQCLATPPSRYNGGELARPRSALDLLIQKHTRCKHRVKYYHVVSGAKSGGYRTAGAGHIMMPTVAFQEQRRRISTAEVSYRSVGTYSHCAWQSTLI